MVKPQGIQSPTFCYAEMAIFVQKYYFALPNQKKGAGLSKKIGKIHEFLWQGHINSKADQNPSAN